MERYDDLLSPNDTVAAMGATAEQRPASRLQEFLAQVESPTPIVLQDAYDVKELTWMCDRLRTSERFGADNHLYLRYSSKAQLERAMREEDWSGVTDAGKVVFLFDSDEQPSTGGRQREPQPLSIEEIVEIVDCIPCGFSGSDFFYMILDSHPNLLTIGWHGLATFPELYRMFCEGKTADEAVEHLSHPRNEKEWNCIKRNLPDMLKYRTEERMKPFLEGLLKCLSQQKMYSMSDWCKAFFLSANAACGRTFPQRMAPAVFYAKHGFAWTSEEEQEFRSGFRYQKFIGIVRAPLSQMGCRQNGLIHDGPMEGWRKHPLATLQAYIFDEDWTYGYYLDPTDSRYALSRQVRFEDLKLYPQETTEKICAFLRIPWSETCMHITTNGDDGGIVDGTEGFDITPVYKLHDEYLSALDKYRIELLNVKNFRVQGYDLKYYDGQRYSDEELKKLFDLPFKVETQTFDNWPGWPDAKVIEAFHARIYKRACEVMTYGETIPPVGKDGRPKCLVQVLYPDLAPGQRIFTNGTMPTSGERCATGLEGRKQGEPKRYIYGAGDFGYRLGRYFQGQKKAFYGFIVSEGAPASMRMGLPVVNVGDFHETDATVYIAIDNAEAVRCVREQLLQEGLAAGRIVDASGFIRGHLRSQK